jgi:predicted transposase YbfD/YdcC
VVNYIRTELNYPGLQQAAVLKKTDSRGTCEIWYLLTSCSREKFPPEAVLKSIRKHWEVENCLHHVKDTTFKEDDHYTISPPQETSLAILRNVVVSVLNLLTPPKQRKINRPIELISYLANPLKGIQQLKKL